MADRRWRIALALAAIAAAGAWADASTGWITPAFDALAHLFYEVPALAALRRPTQLPLARIHLAALSILVITTALQRPPARRWLTVFALGYAIRASVWIAGGNLPLVPGDSCHYIEIATSIYRGEGPVKHYVESYFLDYNPHGFAAKGAVLDDWATPLFATVLALAYKLTGVVPGRSLESTFAVAKGLSFVCNLLCLPAIYLLGRRRYDPSVGLASMALLAVLPVHAVYAGFELRESLVALTSILAVWALTEVWDSNGLRAWGWSLAAGLLAGLAILARNTAMALVAAAGLHALIFHGRRRLGPLILWGLATLAVIAPWALKTQAEYGEPFFTYTKYFQYNFSWAVHHYQKGATSVAEFYTLANAPAIVRVKLKSLAMIVGYSSMILSLPLVVSFCRGLRGRPRGLAGLVAAIMAAFVLGTLANIADVTQVAQLGRYYLPLFVLALPTVAAGLASLGDSIAPRIRPLLAASLVALLWADPTWAYDYSWLTRPYQLHWPAIRVAGDWVKTHPEIVPPEARVMAWFPWETRVAADRSTVLMPRNFDYQSIARSMENYRVTHVVWGSFEPPPHVDAETFGPYLESLRIRLGLTDDREVYRTISRGPYPVRIYRVGGRR